MHLQPPNITLLTQSCLIFPAFWRPLSMIIFSPCLGCVFWAEDKIWTLMQHNNTELTHVQGANPEKPYSMTLDYGGSLEQLEAVIDGSEHCEQEVAYHCKRSRLLNTPGKKHPSWAPLHVPYWGTTV